MGTARDQLPPGNAATITPEVRSQFKISGHATFLGLRGDDQE